MYLIKEENNNFFNGPYPARQKTNHGYKWYGDNNNTFYLTYENGFSCDIGNFREGGIGPSGSLEDISSANFPEGLILTCIPCDTTVYTAKEEWFSFVYLSHEISAEIIYELIYFAKKMILEIQHDTI